MAENQEKPPQAEATVNCVACNKHLKKVKRYYRNGKFYCSKTCWKAYSKKAAEKEAEPAQVKVVFKACIVVHRNAEEAPG